MGAPLDMTLGGGKEKSRLKETWHRTAEEEWSDFGFTFVKGVTVVARNHVAWRRRISGPKSPGGMAKSEKSD